MTAEREARALAALEKSSTERAAALAARERLLQEREEKVRVRLHSLGMILQLWRMGLFEVLSERRA